MRTSATRINGDSHHLSYSAVAIVLHWTIAAAVVGNLLLGWWMAKAVDVPETQLRAITAFQLHKSLGLTVLVLSLLRLGWRLLHPPPPAPADTARWQRLAAAAIHWAFYLLMLALPLSGWLYVSAQWRDGAPLNVPTLWFGLFRVPHLFGLDTVPAATRAMVADNAGETHENLAWICCGLLALHVVAALKHHLFDRDEVLRRMLPGWRSGEQRRAALLLGGFTAMAAAAVALLAALYSTPRGSAAFRVLEETPLGTPVAGGAGSWTFGPEHGSVRFAGTFSGQAFKGEFTRWRARLVFNPEDLTGSSLAAEIETGSATDGVPLHDESLALEEWFDVANHPLARFTSRALRATSGQDFAIDGVLAIKDRQLPVTLELAFDAQGAHVSGKFQVDRAAANLGIESDPDGNYVSRLIDVTVRAAGM